MCLHIPIVTKGMGKCVSVSFGSNLMSAMSITPFDPVVCSFVVLIDDARDIELTFGPLQTRGKYCFGFLL